MSILIATTVQSTNVVVGSNVLISNAGIFVGNSTVNATVNTTSIYLNGISISNNYVRQSFTGTGACTTFTVAGGYTPNNLDVYINGVKQFGNSVNTSSGTTFIFNTAPENGAGIECVGTVATAIDYTTPNTSAQYTWTNNQTFGADVTINANLATGNINGSSLTLSTNSANIGTALIVASNGNVGIGNTTPVDKLAINGTISEVTGVAIRPLVSATAQATTSGTYVDFTGIPSWVKRITLVFQNVSTNGTSYPRFQLGSGSITTSGYFTVTGYAGSSSAASSSTGGWDMYGDAGASEIRTGQITFTLLGSNIWLGTGLFCDEASTAYMWTMSGRVTLSGTLDRVRITTVNGTDTFDAGSVNILYE